MVFLWLGSQVFTGAARTWFSGAKFSWGYERPSLPASWQRVHNRHTSSSSTLTLVYSPIKLTVRLQPQSGACVFVTTNDRYTSFGGYHTPLSITRGVGVDHGEIGISVEDADTFV